MKAILVIEMPDSCFHCPLEQYSNQCGANRKNTKGNANKRPSWCPLKSIPKCRYQRGNERDFTDGFNQCIDEILGEEK